MRKEPSPFNLESEMAFSYIGDSIETKEPSHDETWFIKGLLRHTWLYNNNEGKDAINLTHGYIEASKIVKLYNPTLMDRYEEKLGDITDTDLPDLGYAIRTTNYRRRYGQITGIDRSKETLLFHGTRFNHIENIKSKGISLGYAKDGLYGKKMYLSDCCQKADQYSDDKHNRQSSNFAMFLCRVALGKVGIFSKTKSYCDSLIGGTAVESWRRFYEFMVSEESQIYPAYVIYYDRMPGSLAKFNTTSGSSGTSGNSDSTCALQ